MTRRRHRVLVWSLIGVASLLLIFSMTANWVQRTVLDSDEVAGIRRDPGGPGRAGRAQHLSGRSALRHCGRPGPDRRETAGQREGACAPVAAASRQLALDVSEKALAEPRFQALVSDAIRNGHRQFVKLVRDQDAYVSSTDGKVTLNYGDLVSELLIRLGVDPGDDQPDSRRRAGGIDQSQEGLTTTQSRLESVRSELDKVQGGTLDPEVRQKLESLETGAAELQRESQTQHDDRERAGEGPGATRGPSRKVRGRLSDLDGRLNALEERTAAVLEDPSQANTQELDSSLALVEARVVRLLGRPAIQNPGSSS